MAFLAAVSLGNGQVIPELLIEAARGAPVTWFAPGEPSRGGVVSFSPLAVVERLHLGEQVDCLIAGRIRLDRRQELCVALAGKLPNVEAKSDAGLVLQAYAVWGVGFVERIHGDFAFLIYDNAARKAFVARDRFGVRVLALLRTGSAFWIAGSIQDLTRVPSATSGSLDPIWVRDFLEDGVSRDPARSIYADITRLAPAHLAQLDSSGLSIRRYFRLIVDEPLELSSEAEYIEAFHSHLDAALRDRLPRDRVGVLMSGGLDSTTLAAKAVQLGDSDLAVFARTWLAGGDLDPESSASTLVASHLGIQHTLVDGDRLRLDPDWWNKPGGGIEPSIAVLEPLERIDEVRAMRSEAVRWFYGEGPDNALTFEWQMHLGWLARHGRWTSIPGTVARYLASKSLSEWSLSARSVLARRVSADTESVSKAWIRGAPNREIASERYEWRPRARASFDSPLWPAMFESLDEEYSPHGIEWCHPFMDLRVLEFLLATPPIPWSRRKRLMRRAMVDYLPRETLARSKTPLHRDTFGSLLRQSLDSLPPLTDLIEPFVDAAKLPDRPADYPDVLALIQVAILQHWLANQHG